MQTGLTRNNNAKTLAANTGVCFCMRDGKSLHIADVCMLPKVAGPCNGKTERFYFDIHAKQCLPFEYSGCLG
jgi:hypothetical protein